MAVPFKECCKGEFETVQTTTCSDLETEGKQNQEKAVVTLYVNNSEQEYFLTNYDQKLYASNKSYQDDQDQKHSGSNTIVLDITNKQNHREHPDDQFYQSENDNKPTDSLKLAPDIEETELSYPESDLNNKAESTRRSKFFSLKNKKLICTYLLLLMHVTDANSRFSHEPPREMYVDEGQSISLSYSIIKSGQYEYSVLYTKDNNILGNESVNYQHYTFTSNPLENVYQLKIHRVLREDEGRYKCVAVQSEEPDVWIFSSSTFISVKWVPGQQYPKIVLLKETYHVGEEVNAYCISERIKDPQPELSWFDTHGVSSSFNNKSHFGITLKMNASENMNQKSIHCQMIINTDESPRMTTSKPINITKLLTTTETSDQSTYTNFRETNKVTIYTEPAKMEEGEAVCLSTYIVVVVAVSQLFVLVVYFLLRYTFLSRSKLFIDKNMSSLSTKNGSLRESPAVEEASPLMPGV